MKTPFLWTGSKDKSYSIIKTYIPDFVTYYEPFAGSGAIYFRLLAERGLFPARLNDINKDLITTYEIMRDSPDVLCANLPKKKSRKLYNSLKASTPIDKLEIAVRFLYLNRNSFFGLGGWMNADRYARDAVIDRIQFFSPLMQNSIFTSLDCANYVIDGTYQDFMFCDPPYPEANNSSCYKTGDADIIRLNIDFLTAVYKSNMQFFWVTKNIFEIQSLAQSLKLNFSVKEWKYRKPQQSVQVSEEIYIWRPNMMDNSFFSYD